MGLRTQALLSIIELCNKGLDYMGNDNHEIRVRKGLVNTGDELAKLAHPIAKDLMNCWKDKEMYNPRSLEWKTIDYLEHYCRKWKADRDKLT